MQNLYPLECVERSVENEKEQEGQKEGKSEVKGHEETQRGNRPLRAATRDACIKTQILIDS